MTKLVTITLALGVASLSACNPEGKSSASTSTASSSPTASAASKSAAVCAPGAWTDPKKRVCFVIPKGLKALPEETSDERSYIAFEKEDGHGVNFTIVFNPPDDEYAEGVKDMES